jgi:hypothetical protein
MNFAWIQGQDQLNAENLLDLNLENKSLTKHSESVDVFLSFLLFQPSQKSQQESSNERKILKAGERISSLRSLFQQLGYTSATLNERANKLKSTSTF